MAGSRLGRVPISGFRSRCKRWTVGRRDDSKQLMKIGYMSGPVDAVEVIERWRAGSQTDYFGTSYLMELLDVARDLSMDPVVLTYRGDPSSATTLAGVKVYQIERKGGSGLAYHANAILRVLTSIRILLRERVSVIVVTEGVDHGWLLAPLRLFGIRILPALHGKLWSQFTPVPISHRLFHWLNARLFYRGPALAASGDIARQVGPQAVVFMPTYRPFDIPPSPKEKPFVILSAGRIEEDKGVFDLVEAARILVQRGLSFEMHFCGEGTEMERLERESVGLPILVHGFCGREKLLTLFGQCHVVVVATQAKLGEGFAMICAEGVLAGRPVVTSRVCPALEYIRDAAIEVEPDDVVGYADAFAALMTDRALYRSKADATKSLRQQFFDPQLGYGAVLRKTLLELVPDLAGARATPSRETVPNSAA